MLPKGWVITEWMDAVKISHGQNQKKVESINGIYPIYGSGGQIGMALKYLCKAGSTVVGRKGTINKPFFAQTDFWNIDTAFGITPYEGVLPRYLFAFCLHFNFSTLDLSTTIPSLTQKNLYSIRMPLPPLAEQHLIVAKIDALFSRLDKGVETLQTIRQQLQMYRQAVLKWAFGWKDWEMKPLRSLVESVFDGPFGSNLKTSDYTDSGVRVVRLENIKQMNFYNEKRAFISEDKYQLLKRNTVQYPDMIMSTFISDEIKVCIFPEKIDKAINKADCVCIRTNNSINSKFLMYYLSSKQVYDAFFAKIHGATRPRVNTTQIKEILIPVLQQDEKIKLIVAIESRLSVCDKLEQIVDENLAKATTLRQSILKKAFSGKLVPQDPNDEAADKLLERIKAMKTAISLRSKPLKREKDA